MLTWALTGATTGNSAGTGINYLGTRTFNLGTTTVTYTAGDGAGNTEICTYDVVVTDNQKPVFTSCPVDIAVNNDLNNCTASVTTINPVATDNCSVSVLTWALTGATTGNSAGTGINYLGTRTFNLGTTTVTYTARDGAGNTEICTYDVVVTDNQKPVFTSCPVDIAVNNDLNNCTASVTTINPVATDNCSVSVLTWALTGATTGNSAGTGINYLGTRTFNLGTTTVTYTAGDGAGNTESCTYDVVVTDNQKPVFTSCPVDIAVNNDLNNCTASVTTINPAATDNCSVSVLTWALTGATTGNSAGTGINYLGTRTFNLGTTTVTYTAGDGAGNTESCTYDVVVTDNQKPVFTSCPVDIAVNNDLNNCTASVTTINPVATDNCSVSVLTWALTGATTGNSAGTGINYLGTRTFNLGTTTVTYTAGDGAGNTESCTYDVVVTDNQKPDLHCSSGYNCLQGIRLLI